MRPGDPDDVAASVEIFALCGLAQHPERPTPASRVEEVRDTLQSAATWTFVAEAEGQVVGFAAAMQSRADMGVGKAEPGLCYLDLIFVLPDLWGEGIGALLLDTVIAEARGRAFTRIHLLTHDNNVRAHGLYKSRGFAKGTWSRMSRDPANGMVSEWSRLL